MARAHCMCVTYDPATNTVLTSATVNVYNPGTTTPISPTIFDKSGNVLTNPLTSDATTGLLDFYLNAALTVDLAVSKGGFTTRTYSNVLVIGSTPPAPASPLPRRPTRRYDSELARTARSWCWRRACRRGATPSAPAV